MLERQKYELLRSELKNARLQAKLLQADLAKKLKKPQSYISKVESGERNIDVIEFTSYCEALDLEPSKWLKKLVDKF
ncbi:helix-turn-helix transcriptional regulator [Polynucleobacter paneuropaeus]|jgi:transcriptional regulator with XRE-family HTH domain|nr:helix-turn-helix transcriptional regulator [Polynucleobacter paneuropaeus]